MNCMKCGRELSGQQVFCDRCLADMENYPVKPDIVIQLPRRPDPRRPAAKRGTVNPAQQLEKLKRRFRLTVAILAVAVALAAVGGFLGGIYTQRNIARKQRGQNYSTVATQTPAGDSNVSRETSKG